MMDTRVALRGTLKELLDRRDRINIWLNGLAGVGKTSIAFTVAEEMKKARRLAATFFFSHKHAQSVAKIIPTIAYQLALTFSAHSRRYHESGRGR
jgi:Holliday junction resolvasome RuvABC ATP-dependent DNA helicase subunit